MNNLYLYLDLAAMAGPVLLSFDKKVAYYKNWGKSILAAVLVGIPFIVWDILFTSNGIWGFNDNYLTGLYFFGLPIEELLFFLVVPFACTFIYECFKYYLRDTNTLRVDIVVFALLFVLSITLLFAGGSKWYPLISSSFGLLILFFWTRNKRTSHLGLTLLVSMIPFLLMNGALTGMFTPEPVVWYNTSEMVNVRIISIPIQDIIYGMSLIFSTIFVFEKIK